MPVLVKRSHCNPLPEGGKRRTFWSVGARNHLLCRTRLSLAEGLTCWGSWAVAQLTELHGWRKSRGGSKNQPQKIHFKADLLPWGWTSQRHPAKQSKRRTWVCFQDQASRASTPCPTGFIHVISSCPCGGHPGNMPEAGGRPGSKPAAVEPVLPRSISQPNLVTGLWPSQYSDFF